MMVEMTNDWDAVAHERAATVQYADFVHSNVRIGLTQQKPFYAEIRNAYRRANASFPLVVRLDYECQKKRTILIAQITCILRPSLDRIYTEIKNMQSEDPYPLDADEDWRVCTTPSNSIVASNMILPT